MTNRDIYGKTSKGINIDIPEGWELVPEGEDIPQLHRECWEDYSNGRITWAGYRRCHSTMTPMWARVWGGVRVFARKQIND